MFAFAKTALAVAMTAAVPCVASASMPEWVESKAEFDHQYDVTFDNQATTSEDLKKAVKDMNAAMKEAYGEGNGIFLFNYGEDGTAKSGLSSGLQTLEKNQVGYVTSTDLSTAEGGLNAGPAPVFLQSADGKDVTNKGTIYVVGYKDPEGSKKNYVAEGIGTSGTGNALNEGAIYVDGKNGHLSTLRIKGMATNGTEITNNGLIYVRNGGVAMIDNSTLGTGDSKKIINKKDIVVDGSGLGMYFRKEHAATVANEGTILARGENAFGVFLDNEKGDAGISKTFTNTGSIVATDKATAVLMTAGSHTLKLSGASHIEGAVNIMGTGNSLVVENLDSETETLDLVGTGFNSVSLTDSTIGLGGEGSLSVASFSSEDSSKLRLAGSRSISIETLTGDALTIEADHFAGEGQTISIANNNLTGSTNVEFTAAAVDQLTAEEVEQKLKEQQEALNSDNSTLSGYGTNFTTSVDSDGNVTTTGSDITQSTMDMAAMTLVAWRNETTTLNDRMSTLRSSPAQYGAWVRWNGGEYQYDKRNLSNKFNTIEVGGDVDVGNNWIVGASLSYTKGDGDFQQGESDSDAYAGALYALWTHQSGSFVDMVMKTGRIETDYDFFNQRGGAYDSAKIKQTGFIMGVETGHRFNFTDMFYVEPQIQLTYSRLSGVDETTAHRTVDLEASDSLIGRVGVMAGINCPNNMGSAYVRVSGLRDFRGDIDGTFSANGHEYAVSHELDDNWFEFAVGGSFKLANNFYGFADVQKSTGGDIDLDWRANVGVRAYF